MKTTRIPERVSERFGLFGLIESKRVVLPLKGVECDFSVMSGMVEVSMTQIFRQENSQAMDCEYLFPLPADAAVFFCEADVNGRTIRAQVREREEARQLAAQKKAEGFRTALVESERENLFTLSLGNVQPNDLVLIQLRYFQPLRTLAESRSVEVPFCPGVRYIPGTPLLRSNCGKGTVDDTDQVPDASRITPVRIDAEHPDAAYIDVRGVLDGKFAQETSVCSPSHNIEVCRAGDELRVILSKKAEVPDRDFVLRWEEKKDTAISSRSWLTEKDGYTYALLEIRAPKHASAERAPVDFYFLVDRSGSMQGRKWNRAAEALQSCVQVLGPRDRVMITFFESSFRDFAEGPLPVPKLLEDPQFQNVQQLGTAGGTELAPALKHVLELADRHSRGKDKNLILITDAQVGNESAILQLMQSVPDFPVHCFGIDIALNDALLLSLSRQQGGSFHSLNPNDDIRQALTTLGKTLGQPVLLDAQLSKGWELAEARIPNLYAGHIHHVSARAPTGTPLELKARTASSGPARIHFENQAAAVQAPYLQWCRSRIQRWIAEGEPQKAVTLSIQSNLICARTAFIAWDESEKVAVASHQLVQPSMDLHDVQFQRQPLASYVPAAHVLADRCLIGSFSRAMFDQLLSRDESSTPDDLTADADTLRDELKLKRELSDICHRAAVPDWQRLVKNIFDAIAAVRGEKRSRKVVFVAKLLREVKQLADHIAVFESANNKTGADKARKKIVRLLERAFSSVR